MKNIKEFLKGIISYVFTDTGDKIKVLGQPNPKESVVVSAHWVVAAYKSLSTGSILNLKTSLRDRLRRIETMDDYETLIIEEYMFIMTNKEIKDSLNVGEPEPLA